MDQHKTSIQQASSRLVVSPRARVRPIQAQPKPAPTAAIKRRPVSFKKADVARAISAVAKAGFVAGSIEVTKDGSIRIYAAGTEPTVSLFDQWADKL